MTNFLMGKGYWDYIDGNQCKGYWDYIDGNQEEMPELPDVNPTVEQIKAFKDWNQGARKEKVKGKFPETFEEALQIARVKDRKLEYQAHTSRVEHPQGPTMADERLPPAPTTTPEDPHLELLQRVTNQLDNLSINMVQGVRQQQPQPNNERMPNGPCRQPQRRDYFCYNCGEEGHGMYFSPHPRNFNAQAGRGRQQVTPPRARPPPQIQPQILQNPQMVAQPQVLQRSVSPQPVAEIPPLPNNNGGSALVDKVLEPLDALLQAWEARLKTNQTLEQRWLTYPQPDVETKRLEMCKELIKAAQALMKPNAVRALKQEVLIHKEQEKQGFKESEQVNGARPDTTLSLDHRVVPNTTDDAKSTELMPIPEEEESWPYSLWETIRNRKDGSVTLRSAPILETNLDNEFYPRDIQFLYGDAGMEVSMESKPQSLKTLPSFIGVGNIVAGRRSVGDDARVHR
ncbi:hypothetical protein L7F22_012021 [Adiantum nelumboides]|nr:hypothetical protein [Adiantum nelumboides]